MSLTKRQREILTYLANYSEEHGYAPSFEEIATQFNYNSLATVHEHLTNLERKHYIKRAYNESRGIELIPSDVLPRAMSLPLRAHRSRTDAGVYRGSGGPGSS
jgi:repressor LexA